MDREVREKHSLYLWEQFGIGLQGLREQQRQIKMNERKEKAFDELIAWAAVVDDCIDFGKLPNADTVKNFKRALADAQAVNDYKKGEQIG